MPKSSGPSKHQLQVQAREQRKQERAHVGEGFVEPERWAYDGGIRRGFVIDMDFNPPRVIRKIGWQHCLKCRKPCFSEDVVRLRLCDLCREDEDRFT